MAGGRDPVASWQGRDRTRGWEAQAAAGWWEAGKEIGWEVGEEEIGLGDVRRKRPEDDGSFWKRTDGKLGRKRSDSGVGDTCDGKMVGDLGRDPVGSRKGRDETQYGRRKRRRNGERLGKTSGGS